MKAIPGIEGDRRLRPRLWDYNYYLMSKLANELKQQVERTLLQNGNATVVDFGCGTRPYEPLLANRISQYIGVDFADNPQADVHVDGTGRVPLDSSIADMLLSVQVLEHVTDVETYLSECSRLLTTGGRLLLSTHGMWTYHPYPTDVRRWTCWGLQYEIEQHGFKVERCVGCVGPLAYTTLLRLQLFRGAMYQLGRFTQPIVALVSGCCQLVMQLEDLITPRTVKHENSAVYVISAVRTDD